MEDIFFPVDFATLRDLHRFFMGRQDRASDGKSQRSLIVKSADFMRAYASLEQTATRSGYNPLLEDFLNTSFFLSEWNPSNPDETPLQAPIGSRPSDSR